MAITRKRDAVRRGDIGGELMSQCIGEGRFASPVDAFDSDEHTDQPSPAQYAVARVWRR